MADYQCHLSNTICPSSAPQPCLHFSSRTFSFSRVTLELLCLPISSLSRYLTAISEAHPCSAGFFQDMTGAQVLMSKMKGPLGSLLQPRAHTADMDVREQDVLAGARDTYPDLGVAPGSCGATGTGTLLLSLGQIQFQAQVPGKLRTLGFGNPSSGALSGHSLGNSPENFQCSHRGMVTAPFSLERAQTTDCFR